jgi:subtilisin family serine protease
MFALLAPASASAADTTRIILKREPGLNARERADIRADAGVRLVDTLSPPRTEVVAAPARDARRALRELNADGDVVYAEFDRPIRAFSDDPDFPKQWALQNLGNFSIGPDHAVNDADMDVPFAWSKSTGNGQTIAVVDSGVDRTHPDLAGHVAPGWDFVDNDPDASDGESHGTHVAGTIAATRDNGVGVAGVAPDARILPLRVLDSSGSGFVSDAIEAYDFAADHAVRLINASFGGSTFSQAEYEVIRDHSDVVFVVAAGNGGSDQMGDDNDTVPQYPCSYDLVNIVCVGASRHDDEPASFSNYGETSVDVFAPGYSIYSTVPGAGYDWASGTSMAAPHVSGEAALLLSRNPELTAVDVRDAIVSSAESKTSLADKSASGGRANANRALTRFDSDSDGTAEGFDNCPSIGNPDQADSDGDGIGDACSPVVADRDQDAVEGAADLCPDEYAPYATDGCPSNEPGADGDYWPAGIDQCPTLSGPVRGCPDSDADGAANPFDNCPTTPNAGQGDQDGDHVGDACDPTPRGPDVDRDGKPALDDRCPTVYGALPNGCPYTAPTTSKPADRDGDGFVDASDACPSEYAKTLNGCQLPALTALAAKARKRAATVTVRTSRAATVRITIQRKRGHRWVRITRKTLVTTTGNRVSLKVKRLRKGRYRAVVVLSSSAGRTGATTKAFRVR